MRIVYTLLVVLILASCSKDDAVIASAEPETNAASAIQVIDATINTGFTYELPLPSPDVEIHKQASHFSLSEIGVDAKNGTKVYQYLPSKDFTGTDEVT